MGGSYKDELLESLAIKTINVPSSKLPQHPAHILVINLPYSHWFCIFIFASYIRTSDSQ